MATPAEENRRRVAAMRAGTVKGRIYHPPAKPVKGNPAFARKDKGRVRRV